MAQTNKTVTFLSNNWLALLVLVLVIFLFFGRNPFGCNQPAQPTRDTVTKVDTQWVEQPAVQIPVYVPVQSGSTSYPVVIPQQYQPSGDQTALLKQYNDLVKEFLATKQYKDSIQLKDSSGNRVGVVNLDDKVSQNSIISREPSYQLTLPVRTVTNTITITQPYQPKNQFYISGEITGGTSLVNGAAAGLIWKNRKDQIYGIKGGIMTTPQGVTPYVGLSTYWKIGK